MLALPLNTSCRPSAPNHALNQEDTTAKQPTTDNPVRVAIENSYEYLSRAERIEQADLIFLGRVLFISPTQWNQDSGDYWEETVTDANGLETTYSARPFHQLELSVIRPIAGELASDDQITLTIFGVSPTDQEVTVTSAEHGQVTLATNNETNLQVGDEAVFFTAQREIGWRDGTRTALMLMGVPADSYLLQQNDGLLHPSAANEQPLTLETLLQQIAEHRPPITQP